MQRAVGNLHTLSGQPALDLSPLGRQPLSERRGRPMWRGWIAAMIAATWAPVGSVQTGHRPAATQAAMHLTAGLDAGRQVGEKLWRNCWGNTSGNQAID